MILETALESWKLGISSEKDRGK